MDSISTGFFFELDDDDVEEEEEEEDDDDDDDDEFFVSISDNITLDAKSIIPIFVFDVEFLSFKICDNTTISENNDDSVGLTILVEDDKEEEFE
jgi:hypothetical protein